MTALSKEVKGGSAKPDAKAEVRERITRAALMLLAEEGPSALRVRRVAALAGRTTMCIYSHFGGKDGLVDELHRRGFLDLAAAVEGAPHTDDPVADLVAALRAYRDFAVSNAALYSLMFERSSLLPALQGRSGLDESHAALPALEQAVRRCVEAGAMATDDPAAVAYVLFCAVHGLVSMEGGSVSFDDAVATLVQGLR